MKSIKIIISIFLAVSFVNANDSIDERVLNFEKERFSKNKRIEIKDVKVNLKREMPQKGWYGYIIDLEAKMAGNDVKAKDIVFSNGEIISPELFDIKTGMPLRDLMNPELSDKYYSQKHFIAGNPKAKNKIVVFSDPLCPFCMDYVPDVIKHVNKNKKSIALYYYHFPLRKIHPAADPLSRLMSQAKKFGIKDVELKVYEIDWDEYFDSKETNLKKIVDAFNKEFKTNITQEEILKDNIIQEINDDINMGEEVMVRGTPTIFVNGELDKSKLKYEMLGN